MNPKPPFDPIDILRKIGGADLTPEQEAALSRELSAAYHMDEAASSSKEVRRIAEKVRALLAEDPNNTSR